MKRRENPDPVTRDWAKRNPERRAELAGQRIALFNGELVAFGGSYEDTFVDVIDQGLSVPDVTFDLCPSFEVV